MMRKMKEGDFILTINKNIVFTPQKRKNIHKYSREYILGSKNSKSQSKLSTNSNTGCAPVQNNQSELKSLSKFCLEDKISLLNSRYNSSIKNSIVYSGQLELVQNKIKILNAEENKVKTVQCKSDQQKKKNKRIKKEYEKKQSIIQKIRDLKEREEREKKNKIRDLKWKEEYINNQRQRNNEKNFKKKRNEIKDMKKELWYHISNERDRRKEENKRKKEMIKKIDDDIMKRKKENEKHKNLLIIEQLEKKIKLQEEINGKLLGKIYENKKIGLGKIDKLNKIGKLTEAIKD